MKRNQNNLHRDYIPLKVIECVKDSTIQGIIVKLRFKKIFNKTILQFLWYPLRFKDVYFWLPYKKVVDASNKYSIVGPSSRFPYAKQWFEVQCTSIIYSQGLNQFLFGKNRTFSRDELLTLTRKRVINILDDFVFAKKTTTKK